MALYYVYADGQRVVFNSSCAPVFDRRTGNLRPLMAPPHRECGVFEAEWSRDERVVVFTSDETFAYPDRSQTTVEVYAYDIARNEVTRVSVSTEGVQPEFGDSHDPRVSADGRYVVFITEAGELLDRPAWETDIDQVMLHDRLVGTTEVVSTGTIALTTETACDQPSISDDGRYIAFRCRGADLRTGQPEPGSHLYWKDLQTGRLERIDDAIVLPGIGATKDYPEISPDGRFVAFVAADPRLSGEDPMCGHQLTTTYIYTAGERRLKRVGCSKVQADIGNTYDRHRTRWSPDGRFLAYRTDGEHTPGTSDGARDVFIYSFCPDGR